MSAAPRPPAVLVITHVLPVLASAGNEVRILRLLAWLRDSGYRIVLLLKHETLDPVLRRRLEAVADAVHLIGEPPAEGALARIRGRYRRYDATRSSLFRFASQAWAIVSRIAGRRSAAVRREGERIKRELCPEALVAMTDELCRRYDPVAVIAEYIFMAPCLDVVPPGTLRIIDTHDVFSRKGDEVLSFGIEDPLHCTPQEERFYLLKCDLAIAIQPGEAHSIRRLVPEREVITVTIDFEVDRGTEPAGEVPGRVLIVASDNPLNIHGVGEFLHRAWPRLRAACPQAQLRIVGKVGRGVAADAAGVSLAGWVGDLAGEYRQAAVVVNPVVAGTGLKIKSVEALCHGRALVSTPNGVDGMNFESGLPAVVCRDWDEFVSGIMALLASADRRREMQQAALRYAQRHFARDRVYAPLAEALARAGADRAPRGFSASDRSGAGENGSRP